MKRNSFLLSLILAFGPGAFALRAAPVKIELPPETDAFKHAPGSEFANGQCLTCHSVEYVTMQPVMPRPFWAASVKKMKEKFGAQIPDDQVEALVDYLTRNYGSGTNAAPASPQPVPAHETAKPSVSDGPKLALKYGCLTCHNVSIKIVGPAYREIAAKYKTDSEAKTKIADQIHKGGSGKWGPIIMPPFPQVNDEETKALTDWIMSRN